MKASEIFDNIGKKLAIHYKDLGFKYTKKWGVKKDTDEYIYRISFQSASGNTKNSVALFVNFSIACKSVEGRWGSPEGLLSFSLWDLGNYYEIGESHTMEQTFIEIYKHADILLIPFIDIFENREKESLSEWISKGFLSHIPKELYKYPHLDYTTHNHYWISTSFQDNYNEFGFTISIRYIFQKFGKENAEICLNNYYKSLNDESKKYFKQAYDSTKVSRTAPWECDYQHMPDVEIVKYSVEKDLKLN